MPRIVIDDLEIDVPPGTKVIEAAERLGIMIPRFCYHQAMGSVGACRMCAVKFIHGPFKGVQMSCMIDVQDGMVVSTTDEEAVAFRRQVVEWLMLNHPHDCPVCDEGGQCLLQDETVSSGHGIRRYPGKKRTYINQYLGPFIAHEMNRCIHCYRCSRFYQEFSGYRDLGAMQIGNRVYFGRIADGRLESPFSGNLVDICPTGVYTDKPARFKVRRWDLERSPSVCVHCSLGCNTVANARYRAVMRIEARVNEAVNGHFICDRGRFSFGYANHPQRPRQARIDSQDVDWREAVQEAAARLARIGADAGTKAIASLGSVRSGLETQSMLLHLGRTLDWREPDFFMERSTAGKANAAVSRLSGSLAVSMREVERADFILLIGADPINEAPMLAYAMRQAFRAKAPVVVIDPRPVFLPMLYEHFAVAPKDLETFLGAFIRRAVTREGAAGAGDAGMKFFESLPKDYPSEAGSQDRLSAIVDKMRESRKPVVVCGTNVVRETTPAFAADCAHLLRATRDGAGLFFILPGANAFGAALHSASGGQSFDDTIEAIENGTVKALLVVESDPFQSFPDRQRLEEALSKLDLLVALDCVPSETVRRANILLPTQTIFEAGATLINQEGRVQNAQKAYYGGVPISQISRGGHPPREYGLGIPGSDPRPGWEALSDIHRAITGAGEQEAAQAGPSTSAADEHPSLTLLQKSGFPSEGARFVPDVAGEGSFTSRPAAPGKQGKDSLELLLVDWTFATEELGAFSDTVQLPAPEPHLSMHPKDASRAKLSDGDTAVIHLDQARSIEVQLKTSDKMAQGVVVLPRHWRLEWQKVATLPLTLLLSQIKKN